MRTDWLDEHRVDAIVEPTVPLVARERGHGYDRAFTDYAEISLTHYWDWMCAPISDTLAADRCGCRALKAAPGAAVDEHLKDRMNCGKFAP